MQTCANCQATLTGPGPCVSCGTVPAGEPPRKPLLETNSEGGGPPPPPLVPGQSYPAIPTASPLAVEEKVVPIPVVVGSALALIAVLTTAFLMVSGSDSDDEVETVTVNTSEPRDETNSDGESGPDDGDNPASGLAGEDAEGDSESPSEEDAEPTTTVAAGVYGSDEELDLLWDLCEEGDYASCDDLYYQSPSDSEYEDYGNTCGTVFDPREGFRSCELRTDPNDRLADAHTYGDNPILDELWDLCAAGDGKSCDELYFTAPFDSEYETFGYTCGYRYPEDEALDYCETLIGNLE